jgi:RHS repeat-associated protein
MPTDFGYTGQRSEGYINLLDYHARYYSARLGRFVSADSIIPNPAKAVSFDRFAYADANPLRFKDPSGHKLYCFDGQCFDTLEQVFSSAVTTVNLATSVDDNYWDPINDIGAQYLYNSEKTGIPTGHGNLCGDLALSMIYETWSGQSNTLGLVFKSSPKHGKLARGWNQGTNAYQLGQQFAAVFPAGWRANVYCYQYEYWFEGGYSNANADPQMLSESPYDTGISLGDRGEDYIRRMMTRMLYYGHYVIAGVSQDVHNNARLDPSGVGHWVVVTAIVGDLVHVNNPFTNGHQVYTWDAFYALFGFWLLELLPPPPADAPIPE